MVLIVVQVPLGVLLKNENKIVDMISIMKTLHRYVPTTHKQTKIKLSTGQEEVSDRYTFH